MINQRPKINTGDLNKPITFYITEASSGPEVGEEEEVTLFVCMAEVYESSSKDIEAHSTVSSKDLITVKIRDTNGGYLPVTRDMFRISHHNYRGSYSVVSVSPDNRDRGFIKIVGEFYG